MIYLKTYFHTPRELNFVNMHLMESYDFVDKIILCEFNIHHNGSPREFIYEKNKHIIKPELMDKILYLQCDVQKEAIDAVNNEALAHKNETLMRGYFAKQMHFNDDDIIISVDVDEILYKNCYPEIIENTIKFSKVKIALNQFFYRLNYFWSDNNFIAPTSALYKCYKNNYPCDWRYDGKLLKGKKGCHFSWCMTLENMIYKLKNYAHVKYKHLAEKDILKKAVDNKEYPFDPKKPFTIQIIERTSDILPDSIKDEFFDEFFEKYT